MNPILYLVYQFLKGVTLLAYRIYFRTTRLNPERLKFNRASILVSNHPNTLLDPLNAAKEVPMIVHFLANASLFKGKFQSWFFNTFYCIPVERPQDTKGRPINNRKAFARCNEFLGKGGCLYIAPEGGSEMERKLRPIKTGTARIALNAEEAKNFELGLIIQPVGLTYDNPNYFDSRVLLNAGAPILVKDYQEAYEKDPIATVRQLTADLEDQMRNLLIDTKDEEEDQFIKRLEILQRNAIPLPEQEHFHRTKSMITQLRTWQYSSTEDYDQFKTSVGKYFDLLSNYHTSDQGVYKPLKSLWGWLIALMLSSPVAFYGMLNHLIPSGIALLITRKLNLYVGYNSSVKVLAGILFFPLFYFIQSWIVGAFFGSLPALIYFVSLFPSGWMAWQWWQKSKQWKNAYNGRSCRATLLEMRKNIMNKVESLNQEKKNYGGKTHLNKG